MSIRSLRFWDTSPETQPSGASTTVRRRRKRRRRTYSRRARAGFLTLGVLGFIAFGIAGFGMTLQIAEQLNPSGRVYIQSEGQKVYLEQSQVVVPPPDPSALQGAAGLLETGSSGAGATPDEAREVTTPAETERQTGNQESDNRERSPQATVPLPPVRLEIPALELDVPILLADNDNLPRQQYAGWLFKSAFPATVGNMVILGHLDGTAAIFGRLNELQPGDEIRIHTRNHMHTYVVQEALTVDETAVEVLAPTDEPIATLITCAGDWNPYTRSYDKRLVVRAIYAAVEEIPA